MNETLIDEYAEFTDEELEQAVIKQISESLSNLPNGSYPQNIESINYWKHRLDTFSNTIQNKVKNYRLKECYIKWIGYFKSSLNDAEQSLHNRERLAKIVLPDVSIEGSSN